MNLLHFELPASEGVEIRGDPLALSNQLNFDFLAGSKLQLYPNN